MKLKTTQTYHNLAVKPSVFAPAKFQIAQAQSKYEDSICQQNMHQQFKKDWNLPNFNSLIQLQTKLTRFSNNLSDLINQYKNASQNNKINRENTKEEVQKFKKRIASNLKVLKQIMKRANFQRVQINYQQIFIQKKQQKLNPILSLFQKPTNFQIPFLISETQRYMNKEEQQILIQTQVQQIIKSKFPYVILFKATVIDQIKQILKMIKQNLYTPSEQIFKEAFEKKVAQNQNLFNSVCFNSKLSLKQNLYMFHQQLKQFNADNRQNYRAYYTLLVYEQCTNLQGLCHFLSYSKNILLDHSNGTLSSDYQTWLGIYEASIKLYCRNKVVRQNQLIQIDQILSSPFSDKQFYQFLEQSLDLNKQNDEISFNKYERVSLPSINFYLKNSISSQKQTLRRIIKNKIKNELQSTNPWKSAQDIVQFIDCDCVQQDRNQLFQKVAQVICRTLTLNKDQDCQINCGQIKIAITLYVDCMSKYLQIVDKIFNIQNLTLILTKINKKQKINTFKVKVLHHLFSKLIFSAYNQSQQLEEYFQTQPKIIQVMLALIPQFKAYDLNLSKQFYKILINLIPLPQEDNVHSLDLQMKQFYFGIAELYFVQSFEQSVDMQLFHSDQRHKKIILDCIVQLFSKIGSTDYVQFAQFNNMLSAYTCKDVQENRQSKASMLESYLAIKSLKDNLIFQNLLLMTTYFQKDLPLQQILVFMLNYYNPLTEDINWKLSNTDGELPITILSLVAEQIPIQILKATYKFLKDGISINFQTLKTLSTKYWNCYFSKSSDIKIRATVNQIFQGNLTVEVYQNLHNLKKLELVLNMISCVFDKLNESSQKSIKQIKTMYEWGTKHITQILKTQYSTFMDSMIYGIQQSGKKQLQQNQLQEIEICNKQKNISVLQFNLLQQNFLLATFKQFNKIGKVIQNISIFNEVNQLIFPIFVHNSKKLSEFNKLVNLFFLVENSCLPQILSDDCFDSVSIVHLQKKDFYLKANSILLYFIQHFDIKNIIQAQSGLQKRFASHLKLQICKMFIPSIVRKLFQINMEEQKQVKQVMEVLKNSIKVMYILDKTFEEHFIQIMQVIEQVILKQSKQTQQNSPTSQKGKIILSILELFFSSILQNIKIRSYHLFRLVKIYLKLQNQSITNFNEVINHYIKLFLTQFVEHSFYTENIEIKSLCADYKNASSQNKLYEHNSRLNCQKLDVQKYPQLETPKKFKSKQIKSPQKQNSFHSPTKKDKISLTQLRQKKMSSSPKDSSLICHLDRKYKNLLHNKHCLNFAQVSCTLSMFINLFSRINYGSLTQGVQKIYASSTDKIIYLRYLINLTDKLNINQINKKVQISKRDLEILNVDVYGNLSGILKTATINDEIMHLIIILAKKMTKLQLNIQGLKNLPFRLLSSKLFPNSGLQFGQDLSVGHFYINNCTKQQENIACAQLLFNKIKDFENQPEAFQLILKLHYYKLFNLIQYSNLHLCNVEYISSQINSQNCKNSSNQVKKVIELNQKIVLSHIKQVKTDKRKKLELINKKYKEKVKWQNQKLKIQISEDAYSYLDSLLNIFLKNNQKIKPFFQNQRQSINSKQQNGGELFKQFYGQFKQLALIIMNFPEFANYVMTKEIIINTMHTNFIKTIISNLQHDFGLPMFCQFYMSLIKTNSGFVQKTIQQIECLFEELDSKSIEFKNTLKSHFSQKQILPLHMWIQIQLKIHLSNNCENKNQLKALIFTFDQTNQHRFRFYKFTKIINQLPQKLIKQIDRLLLQRLTLKFNSINKYKEKIWQNQEKQSKKVNDLNSWLKLFSIMCKQFVSSQIIDYGKVTLDKKLKGLFLNSEGKQNIPLSKDINKYQQDIQSQESLNKWHQKNKLNIKASFQLSKNLIERAQQIAKNYKSRNDGKKILQFDISKEQIISHNEISSLKEWWLQQKVNSRQRQLNLAVIEELTQTSNELAWSSLNEGNITQTPNGTFFQVKQVLMVQQSNDMIAFHQQIQKQNNGEQTDQLNVQNDGIVESYSSEQSLLCEQHNKCQLNDNCSNQVEIVSLIQNNDQIVQNQSQYGTDKQIQSIKEVSSFNNFLVDQIRQQNTDGSIKIIQQDQQPVFGQNEDHCLNDEQSDDFQSIVLLPQQCTIDKLTEPNVICKNNQNQIQVNNELQNQILQSGPIFKEDLLHLIQDISLNPEMIKVLSKRLKRMNNVQIRKLFEFTSGDVKNIVETQLKKRGLYIYQQFDSCGMMTGFNSIKGIKSSLFSINKFICSSFHIDQSKLYQTNVKKLQSVQRVSNTLKIFLAQLNNQQWIKVVQLYCQLATQEKTNNNHRITKQKQVLQIIMNLLVISANCIHFVSLSLKILTVNSEDDFKQIFKLEGSYLKLKQIKFVIVNDLLATMIINRIGLPLLLKVKWNFNFKTFAQNKKQVRSTFSKLKQYHQNQYQKQDQIVLNILLKTAISFISQHWENSKYLTLANCKLKSGDLNFLSVLSQYFFAVQNNHSNGSYPYYEIQDSMSISVQITQVFSQKLRQIFKLSEKTQSKQTSFETFFNLAMRIFTYLDLQFFSKFLQHQLKQAQTIFNNIINRESSVLKNFNKICSSSIQIQKKAQIYWQMRKQKKCDQLNREIKYVTYVLIQMSSSTYQQFKQTCFKFAYGKQQFLRKQKIMELHKKLLKYNNAQNTVLIRQQINQMEKYVTSWKSNQINTIIKQDIIPFIEKCSCEFIKLVMKVQDIFNQIWSVFGGQLPERMVLYKQCSQFYKVILVFQIFTKEEEIDFHSMSSLKTKPSLQSTKQMVTGKRRSSLKLQRLSLNIGMPNIKHTMKCISPKFGFFGDILQLNEPQKVNVFMKQILKVHVKYSTIQSKLKFLHMNQKKQRPQKIIQCSRQNVWIDTLACLDKNFAQSSIKIKLGQQLGLDYGGVRRQWITLIIKQLVNPNLGLFQLSANGLSFQPSKNSSIVPNHLLHFQKLGMLVGKALKQNWLLQINFTRSFLKHLLGFTLYVEDLEDIDPDTAKGLLWVLNNQVNEDLGITFAHNVTCLGKNKTIQLIENGSQIYVNQQNKKDYIKKLANYIMTQQIRQQSKAFMMGVQQIVPYQILKLFSYKQIGMYIAGMPTINIDQMKKYCRYQGFSEESLSQNQTIKWFWEVMQQNNEDQDFKANFLFFLTGSYKVPYGGFKENPIGINQMPGCKDYLPVAHTCFSVMDISTYSSKDKLQKLLLKSLKEGKGFSIS